MILGNTNEPRVVARADGARKNVRGSREATKGRVMWVGASQGRAVGVLKDGKKGRVVREVRETEHERARAVREKPLKGSW